jgi:hypothetical protein
MADLAKHQWLAHGIEVTPGTVPLVLTGDGPVAQKDPRMTRAAGKWSPRPGCGECARITHGPARARHIRKVHAAEPPAPARAKPGRRPKPTGPGILGTDAAVAALDAKIAKLQRLRAELVEVLG